jgi:hypothetical protein
MSSYISGSTVIKNRLSSILLSGVKTVGVAVTVMESMMAEVAYLNSVEQHITAAIKNSIDFE